jgi:hypothetical protein
VNLFQPTIGDIVVIYRKFKADFSVIGVLSVAEASPCGYKQHWNERFAYIKRSFSRSRFGANGLVTQLLREKLWLLRKLVFTPYVLSGEMARK